MSIHVPYRSLASVHLRASLKGSAKPESLTDALLLAHLYDLAHVLAACLGKTVIEDRFG
jgi:hypothetical protein